LGKHASELLNPIYFIAPILNLRFMRRIHLFAEVIPVRIKS
jgi:hypothetical protein